MIWIGFKKREMKKIKPIKNSLLKALIRINVELYCLYYILSKTLAMTG